MGVQTRPFNGAALRADLRRLGLRQYEFATLTGLHHQTICAYINGRDLPSLRVQRLMKFVIDHYFLPPDIKRKPRRAA